MEREHPSLTPCLSPLTRIAGALRDVERELRDRYARHYRVMCMRSPHEARARLEELAAAGEEVALVLAGQWLSGMTGSELLDEARRLHPHARRGLLIAWGDWGDRRRARRSSTRSPTVASTTTCSGRRRHRTSSSIRRSPACCSSGRRRSAPRRTRSTSSASPGPAGPTSCGRHSGAARCRTRSAWPTRTTAAPSSPQAGDGAKLPLVVFPDGTVLTDPSNAEIAQAAGSPVNPERMDFDLVIVGAGPAGLSAAVYGASEGFSTLVVDEGGIGGQATSSSLIRNYLGFPRGVSGRRLAQQAYEQAWVFGANFAFMQRVTDLRRERRRALRQPSPTAAACAPARCCWRPAPRYRRLGVPALEALNGAGVFYGGPASEAPAMAGRDVYVLGGANSAGQAALHLARYARRVTLVVRAQSLERRDVALPGPPGRGDAKPRGPPRDRGRRRRRRRLARAPRASRPRGRKRGDRRRRRALPHDRSAPAHRLAAAGGRAG